MLVLIKGQLILVTLRQTSNIQYRTILHFPPDHHNIISLRSVIHNAYFGLFSAPAVDRPILVEAHLLAADLLDIVVTGDHLHHP
jgi:hypothetical protein